LPLPVATLKVAAETAITEAIATIEIVFMLGLQQGYSTQQTW
jgi:hypothetical protein